MATRIESPFLHFTIPNFLSEEKHQRITEAYSRLQFIEKESDLFHFFQTNELNAEPTVAFFKEELDREFGKLTDLKDSSYNIFASYYFKGDYLLCHDDVVEDRRFAFSYYLEDHPNAELVLYDKTATKIERKYKVTRNLLVIFEVSNISYHEVAYSSQDGRKAVTGWLNIKGQGQKREAKKIEQFRPNIPSDLLTYKLEEDLSA
jgi:Rps23 Pro-64 3,4-dihydroxylase Tpa1-like proline 4-hydroxylase